VSSGIDLPLRAWDAVVGTNLTSCFVLAQQVAPGMIERGRGKIINICSVHNRLVRGRVGAYAAAKAGLGGLTQVMCASWAGHGIQANGLAPGFIATEMTMRLRNDRDFDSWLRTRTPAGLAVSPASSAIRRGDESSSRNAIFLPPAALQSQPHATQRPARS